MPEAKLLTLSEAIDRFVPDGSSIAMGLAQETLIPFAAGHELIRQRKKNLTLIGPISDILFDQIIGGAGVVKVRAIIFAGRLKAAPWIWKTTQI